MRTWCIGARFWHSFIVARSLRFLDYNPRRLQEPAVFRVHLKNMGNHYILPTAQQLDCPLKRVKLRHIILLIGHACPRRPLCIRRDLADIPKGEIFASAVLEVPVFGESGRPWNDRDIGRFDVGGVFLVTIFRRDWLPGVLEQRKVADGVATLSGAIRRETAEIDSLHVPPRSPLVLLCPPATRSRPFCLWGESRTLSWCRGIRRPCPSQAV